MAHPLPATLGALHLLLSGKQTNKFSALTPLPLAPAAMDHRQQQKQQQQQSSPAALSAENGLQLQLGIMLCIFDMAQTAADPPYILTPLPPIPLITPPCATQAREAHNGKTIFVLKITKLMASFRLPRPCR